MRFFKAYQIQDDRRFSVAFGLSGRVLQELSDKLQSWLRYRHIDALVEPAYSIPLCEMIALLSFDSVQAVVSLRAGGCVASAKGMSLPTNGQTLTIFKHPSILMTLK